MADEITISAGLAVEKVNLKLSIPSKQFKADMAGDQFIRNAQTIGTSHEALVVGDVGTAGVGYFTNLDATNFVEIGVDVAASFYELVKLMPGESAVLRLATNAPYAQADTASVILDYTIIEA